MEFSTNFFIKDSIFSFTIFYDLEKTFLKKFNILENDIIISKLAKVQLGFYSICAFNVKCTPLFKILLWNYKWIKT
jgi:hypothetical protein